DIRSDTPSPLKPPTATDQGCTPALKFTAAWKVPSRLPNSTETLPMPPARLATARDSGVIGHSQVGHAIGVGCENLVTPPGRTRGAIHRDDRDARHGSRPARSPAQPRRLSDAAAWGPALGEAGDHRDVRRRRPGLV